MAHSYEARDYTHLLGMEGFSDDLLNTHFKLYEGYVENANKLLEALDSEERSGKDLEFAELHRRLGFELNGMRMHEYYFDNLGGDGEFPEGSELSEMIEASFGDFDTWKEEFAAVATMRGVGWAVLYYDPEADRLFNMWIGEHEIGHPAGWQPILVLDVWEHAYMLDYGSERTEYIEAFFKNLEWELPAQRLEQAVQVEARVG